MATYGAAQGGGWLVVILMVLGAVIGVFYAIVWAVRFVLRTFLYPVYNFIVSVVTSISVYTATNPEIVFGALALPGLVLALLGWALEDEMEEEDEDELRLVGGIAGAVGLGSLYGAMELMAGDPGILGLVGVLFLLLLMILCVLVSMVSILLFGKGIGGFVGRLGSVTAILWWGWFVLFGNRLDLSRRVLGLGPADALLTSVLAVVVLAVALSRLGSAIEDRFASDSSNDLGYR